MKEETKLYRKSILLKAACWLFFVFDILSFFLAPVWVSVVFMIVHACLFAFYIVVRCRLFDLFFDELFQ